MDSKTVKLAFALNEAKEKEAIYRLVYAKLASVLDQLEVVLNAAEGNNGSSAIANIKQLFYLRKSTRLLKKAEQLHVISTVRFKEWEWAINKI